MAVELSLNIFNIIIIFNLLVALSFEPTVPLDSAVFVDFAQKQFAHKSSERQTLLYTHSHTQCVVQLWKWTRQE